MNQTTVLPEPIIGNGFDRTIKIDVYAPSPGKPGYERIVRRMTWRELASACDACLKSVPSLADLADHHGLAPSIKRGYAGSPRPDDEIPKDWQLNVSWEVGGSEGYYVHVIICAPVESHLRKAVRAACLDLGNFTPEFTEQGYMTSDSIKKGTSLRDLREALRNDDQENRLFRNLAWGAKFFDCNSAIAATLQLSRALMWRGSGMDNHLRDIIGFLNEKTES